MGDSARGLVFTANHREMHVRALEAVTALTTGHKDPARALLGSWRFSTEPVLMEAALTAVQAAHPQPPALLLQANGEGFEALEQEMFADELAWRARRWEVAADRGEAARGSILLAWTLDELACLGRGLRRWDRAWPRPARVDPDLDELAAAAWANLFSARPFGASTYIRRHLEPAAVRVFGSVMLASELPRAERNRVQRDLSESFLALMLAPGGGVPPWLDLALRVLERGPSGPLLELSRRVPPGAWATAAGCLAGKRTWTETLHLIWPSLRGPTRRGRRLTLHIQADPERFIAVLELHLVVRMCRIWTDGGREATRPDHALLVLRRNLVRVRARLRALVAEAPAPLLEAVLQTEGLHYATVSAIRRLAWAWARRELETHFSMSFARSTLARCALIPEDDPAPDAIDAEGRAALNVWVLLVALRGRLGHLRLWVEQGTTGDHDAVWGRLLSDALPVGLVVETSRSRPRLRRLLSGALDEILAGHQATVAGIAQCPPGRGLRGACEKLLRPIWHARVPFPERDFPGMVRHARRFLYDQRLEETT